MSPMPTATGAGTPRNSTSTGTVIVPAPTPVSAMNSAMKNPMMYGIPLFLSAVPCLYLLTC